MDVSLLYTIFNHNEQTNATSENRCAGEISNDVKPTRCTGKTNGLRVAAARAPVTNAFGFRVPRVARSSNITDDRVVLFGRRPGFFGRMKYDTRRPTFRATGGPARGVEEEKAGRREYKKTNSIIGPADRRKIENGIPPVTASADRIKWETWSVRRRRLTEHGGGTDHTQTDDK